MNEPKFVIETDLTWYGETLFVRWWKRPENYYNDPPSFFTDCRLSVAEALKLRDAIRSGAMSFTPREVMRGVIRVILAEPEVYPGEFMDPAYYDGAYGDDTATRLWWPMLAADQDLEDLLGFKVFAQYDPETFDAALKAWTEHLDDPADL